MSNVNALLNARLKKSDQSKMAALAKQSATGNLTSFSGIFGTSELNDQEKTTLEDLLKSHLVDGKDFTQDLNTLISITSEIKAINNQAAILHGERIKKAHTILTGYRDGAFTAWLMAAYGNRQTPYNFMQYYDFYEAMPKTLRPQIEAMPRQAVYTLATREGTLEKKQEIVEKYNGETKVQLLQMIRESFPLAPQDRRRKNIADSTILGLTRLSLALKNTQFSATKQQCETILQLLETLRANFVTK
jgi:hypothetical protein